MTAKPVFFRPMLAVILQSFYLVAAHSATLPEGLIACAPDQTHVAVVADHGRVQYRRTSDNGVEQTFYICHAQALVFSPDGKLFAAAGAANGSQAKIKVWNVADRKQLCEIITSSDSAKSLALSLDGSVVVGAASDGRVEAWRVADGKPQWSRTFSSIAKSIRFSAGAKNLLVHCADGTEHALNSANGRNVLSAQVAKK